MSDVKSFIKEVLFPNIFSASIYIPTLFSRTKYLLYNDYLIMLNKLVIQIHHQQTIVLLMDFAYLRECKLLFNLTLISKMIHQVNKKLKITLFYLRDIGTEKIIFLHGMTATYENASNLFSSIGV